MDFHRYCLVCVVSFSLVFLGLSVEQDSSKVNVAGDISEPVVISNATLDFVSKVFRRYSKNSTERMTVDGFYRLLETLRIGQVFDISGHAETVDRNELKEVTATEQEKHAHRRSVEEESAHHKKVSPHYERFHNNCLSKDDLLEIHHINKNKVITIDDFIQLCPSLVYEVQSGSCWHDPEGAAKVVGGGVTLLVWGYGFASVTVISLSSLLAIAIIPCLGKAVYNKVMSFLVALAVGTLAGDAFLHLIPHAFLRGVHIHEGHDEDHVNPLWKGVVIMSGIYLFFMIESFVKARLYVHQKRQHHEEPQMEERCATPLPHDPLVDPKDIVNHDNCSPRDCNEANRETKGVTSPRTLESAYMTDSSQSDVGIDCDTAVQFQDEGITIIENKTNWKTPAFFPDDITKHGFNDADAKVVIEKEAPFDDSYSYTGCDVHHFHDASQLSPRFQSSESGATLNESKKVAVVEDTHHGHHHHDKSIDKNTSVATVAWMVIVGDGFHNLSDGLAVGAAFSSSITTGVTTAIAVLCHELPHELGDFAILIKSGISFRQAIAYNLASAFISYLGLVIGMGLGNLDTSHVWVLALTAGLFLYISLVSMLPELKAYQNKGGFSVFFSQNAGILTGILIMLVIALFEKH